MVPTAATIPTILSGEPVTRPAGGNQTPVTVASGGPLIAGGPGTATPMLGVAASTSTEGSSGTAFGSVSITPFDESLTYLVSTLQTTAYFGNPSSGATLQQQQYDTQVGNRVTFARTGGVGSGQLGGTFTINSTDATANGLIVEELDIVKFPGKVRFSFRNSLSYLQ